MRRVPDARVVVWLAAAVTLPAPARAQAIGEGFEYERTGRAAEAAQIYLTTLRAEPANAAALLGLERVLPKLDRLIELVPLVRRARALDPGNVMLRGIELRTYAGLNETDSVDAVARRWVAETPRGEAPYREWLIALEDQRLFSQARAVIAEARRALNRPVALAIEAAELELQTGNWTSAAREWATAVQTTPSILANATSQLEDAPATARDSVVGVLTAAGTGTPARWLAAELRLVWADPLKGWALLEPTLTPPNAEVAGELRRFADLATGGGAGHPEYQRVRGLALSRYADLVPAALGARIRVDAAQALLAGGDRGTAGTVLERIAADSATGADVRALAQTALVRVRVDQGRLDDAETGLAALGDGIPEEDRSGLRRAIVRGRIARGELDRAAASLAGDSSIDALALTGWIALYRGDLKDAVDRFRAAGPYAGDRRDATARTAMLALLQGIRATQSPALGGALLLLERGDSAAAVAALRGAGESLGSGGGRADVLLLAAQVAASLGGAQDTVATALFADVVRTGGDGAAAPAADLGWARLLMRQGRGAAAVARLEHLILTYPGSALVPEARRDMERAKGAIPRS